MTIDTGTLEDIGLTRAQAKVYVSLLALGETTSGPLIRKSELPNSVVYNALNQLIKQGLATFVLKGKRKYFSAADPRQLRAIVDEKKENIEKLLPELSAMQKLAETKLEAHVFLGWKGVYAAFNLILELLPKGSEYIAFGAGFEEQYSEEATKFFREFQKKRALKKYKIKIIVNETARKQVEEYPWYPKFGKPEYHFVPGFAPIGVIIFGDNVLNVVFDETPVAVMTVSRQIAESYRRCFYSMWKVAKS